MKRSSGRFNDRDSFHEATSPIRAIQQTLFHLGDKHPTLSRSEDLNISIDMLQSEFPKHKEEILEALLACVAELPHKLDVYVDLVGGLHGKEPSVAVEIVETVYKHLFLVAAKAGTWRHLLQALRFLSVTVTTDSLNELLQWILSSEMGNFDQFPSWLILSALPWVRRTSESAYEACLAQIPSHAFLELHGLVSTLQSLDIPSIPKNALALSIQLLPPPSEPLAVDASWKAAALAKMHPTIFADTFDRVAAIQIFVYEQLTQLSISFGLNHRRLADALLAAIGGWSEWGHPEKMLAEWIFQSQMLCEQGESDDLIIFKRSIAWQVVLGNCCRQSRHFPPILARTIFALVSAERISQLGWVHLDRLARYFALHLTSFDFKWPWDEWSHLAGKEGTFFNESSSEYLQVAFLKLTLEELSRLSYPDRLAEVLPGWLQAFLPAGLGETTIEADGDVLVKAIKDHQSPAQIEVILAEQLLDDQKIAFVKAMLVATAGGSFAHCQTCIEAYLGVLQRLFPKMASVEAEIADRSPALDAIVTAFSGKIRLHVEFWIGKMVHYRLISPIAVISYLSQYQVDKSNPCGIFLDWSIYSGVLEQSRLFPQTVERKMAALSQGDPQREKLTSTIERLKIEYQDTVNRAISGMQASATSLDPLTAPLFGDMIEKLRQRHSTNLVQ